MSANRANLLDDLEKSPKKSERSEKDFTGQSPHSAATKPSENAESIIPIKGKKIVLIGDGPIALLAAVKLKQKGVTDVTIAGSRLGNFTRSNDAVSDVFNIISTAIAPLSITPSYGRHIKDVERELYIHAKKLGVKFIKKNFDSFLENKKLLLVAQNQTEQEIIEADLVFDCTGVKRNVMNKFNQSQSNFQFEIKKIECIAKPYWAFLRFKFHVDLARLVNYIAAGYSRQIKDPNVYTHTIEELQKLGWDGYNIPFFYINPLLDGDDQCKSNMYSEIPAGLTDDDKIIKFIKILIKYSLSDIPPLKTFEPKLVLLQSKKHPTKPVISKFHIEPHQTISEYYLGNANFPNIFHLGDASADLPFHFGEGIVYGTKRLEDALKCFTVANGELTSLNAKQFTVLFNAGLTKHVERIQKNIYENQAIEKAYFGNIAGVYQLALSSNNNTNVEKLKMGLKKAIIWDKFTKCKIKMIPCLDNNLNARENTGFIIENNIEKKLTLTFKKLLHIFKSKNIFPSNLFIPINNYTLNIAMRCKKLGETHFKLKKLSKAKWAYQLSLDIYSKLLCSSEHIPQQLALTSNLIIIAYKQKDYSEILALSNNGNNELLISADKTKYKSILDKIYFHTAYAAINLAKKPSDENELAKLKKIAEVSIANLSELSKEQALSLQCKLIQLDKKTEQTENTPNC